MKRYKYKVYLTTDERYGMERAIHQRFIRTIRTKDKLNGQDKIFVKIPVWDKLNQREVKEVVMVSIIRTAKMLNKDIIVVKAVVGE